jgi:hypothetical protein
MNAISRLKRAGAIVGVGAVVVGGAVLGTTQAHAAARLGTDATIGNLAIQVGGVTPNNASTSVTGVTSSIATGCDTGPSSSAVVRLVDPVSGSVITSLTGIIAGASSPQSGIPWNTTLASQITGHSDLLGSQAEIVVLCDSAPSLGPGTTKYEQDTYVNISTDGSTFTETNSVAQPPTPVTVTLTSIPATGTVGTPLTLKATVSPVGATGQIQFEDTSTATPTNLGAAVNISGGVAQTSFTPSAVALAPGEPLKAVYLPTGNFTFSDTATDAIGLVVSAAAPNSGAIPLAVIVPASGTFSVSVNTTQWVVLNVTDPTNPIDATAATTPITVTDTRNSYPGWSVSGQSTALSGTIPSTPAGYPAYNAATVAADHATQSIAADQLGWTPTGPATLPPGVHLGNQVPAGTTTNGLGDVAQVLASVHAGTGDGFTGTAGAVFGANLDLAIPAGQEAGPYAGFLNITSVNALP